TNEGWSTGTRERCPPTSSASTGRTSRSCDGPRWARRPEWLLRQRPREGAASFAHSLDVTLPALLGRLAAEVRAGQVRIVLQDAVRLVDVGVVLPVEALRGLPLAFPHLRVDQFVLDFHRLPVVHQPDAFEQLELVRDRDAEVDVVVVGFEVLGV